jgi:hypothetical protein
MTRYTQIGGENIIWLPSHNGGTCMVCDGTAHAVTIPDGTKSVYLKAEGAAVYYNLGTAAAGTTSYGYVPVDGHDMVFACDNLTDMSLFGAATAIAHIQFYTG